MTDRKAEKKCMRKYIKKNGRIIYDYYDQSIDPEYETFTCSCENYEKVRDIKCMRNVNKHDKSYKHLKFIFDQVKNEMEKEKYFDIFSKSNYEVNYNELSNDYDMAKHLFKFIEIE